MDLFAQMAISEKKKKKKAFVSFFFIFTYTSLTNGRDERRHHDIFDKYNR